jgi:hypothetical protein
MGRPSIPKYIENRCDEVGRNCEKEFLRFWTSRGSITVENEQSLPQPNKLELDQAAEQKDVSS